MTFYNQRVKGQFTVTLSVIQCHSSATTTWPVHTKVRRKISFNVFSSSFCSKSCAQQASTTWVWTFGRPPTSTPSRRSSKSTMRLDLPSHKWPITTRTSSPSPPPPAILPPLNSLQNISLFTAAFKNTHTQMQNAHTHTWLCWLAWCLSCDVCAAIILILCWSLALFLFLPKVILRKSRWRVTSRQNKKTPVPPAAPHRNTHNIVVWQPCSKRPLCGRWMHVWLSSCDYFSWQPFRCLISERGVLWEEDGHFSLILTKRDLDLTSCE